MTKFEQALRAAFERTAGDENCTKAVAERMERRNG